MNSDNILTVQCPTCRKAVEWRPENEFRPFCSHRCQLIDLGAWSSEEYRIPENQQQENWSELPEEINLAKKSLN